MRETTQKAIALLKELIEIPSISREEKGVSDKMFHFLKTEGYHPQRKGWNVWVQSQHFDAKKPTLLLNSHLDTVQPVAHYTRNPFSATEENGRLYGLGSNDAGGCLVALLATFLELDKHPQPYNLLYLASVEEEISGAGGVALVQSELGELAVGIVGEPTQMQMAVAEKGLMVLDCTVRGKAGHAARNEGENAIYKSMKSIDWFRYYAFDKKSDLLGDVKMTVSQIEAGTQHNVVPAECRFVVDVRVNECYTNEEVFELIASQAGCEVEARSFRLGSSSIPLAHPLVQRGVQLGLSYYGSPTMSDQALFRGFPTLKIGPGDSARSHTADEYIYLSEIEEGVELYLQLLEGVNMIE